MWLLSLLVVLTVLLLTPSWVVWVLVGCAWGVSVVSLVAGRSYAQARAKLRSKQYDAAFDSLHQFEEHVSFDGWRKQLAFLYTGLLTSNPVALARGYKGVVRLEQGRLAEAEQWIQSAIEQDREYALPWANGAIVHALRGNEDKARAFAAEAARLGFRNRQFQEVLAMALAKGQRAAGPFNAQAPPTES
jgi:tetratricopeptide (TPR) repeat protein